MKYKKPHNNIKYQIFITNKQIKFKSLKQLNEIKNKQIKFRSLQKLNEIKINLLIIGVDATVLV